MDGFQRRTQKKKENIRQAALELFRKHGFGKVSVQDIAREANVSHVTVYKYFGDKENLVKEIIKLIIKDRMSQFEALVLSDVPFLQKLDGFIFSKVQNAGQFRGQLAQIATGNPELKDWVDELWRTEVTRLMKHVLAEGQAGGYISRDITLEAVMVFFDIVRAGVFALSDELRRFEGNKQISKEINHLFVYGLVDRIPAPDRPA